MTVTHSPAPAGSSVARHPRTAALWTVQIALAAQFAGGGLLKFVGSGGMTEMFADIGAGQWLRYVVGVLELAGAVGLLVPRLSSAAALGLSGVMAGAALTNAAVLGASPALPLVLLVLLVAVARARWNRPRPVVASLARPSPAKEA